MERASNREDKMGRREKERLQDGLAASPVMKY